MSNSITKQSSKSFNQFDFVKALYECEKDKYILENRKAKILKRISLLSQKCDFSQSSYSSYEKKKKRNMPHEPEKEKISSDDFDLALLVACGVSIGVFILNLIIKFLGMLGLIPKFSILGHHWFAVLIVMFVSLFALVLIIKYGIYSKKNKDALEKYQKSCEKIRKENANVDEYNNKMYRQQYEKYALTNKRIEERANEYKNETKDELELIRQNLNKINNTLEFLYNLRINDVLCYHPNYRGLIPVSVIYGYFDTGRCTQLQGHEGAYNLYEDEKMKGMIINKIDVITKQMWKLNQNMIYVGKAVEECNAKLSELESTSNRVANGLESVNSNINKQMKNTSYQLSDIERNTANGAYYAKIGAEMSTLTAIYNVYNS